LIAGQAQFKIQNIKFKISLPVFNKLRTVIYKVDDLDAAKAWYINITGVKPYFDQPFYVGFDINGCELGLDPDLNGTIAGNNSVSYWAVDELVTSLDKLAENGAIVVQPKTNVGGTIFVAIVKDPFDNHIGLIEGA
jgi:predicted enzyme related to lactoylglutathione lyase